MKIENKNYSLIKGDCLQLLKQLKDASIDAIVTDPPYQYLNIKKKIANLINHIMKKLTLQK